MWLTILIIAAVVALIVLFIRSKSGEKEIDIPPTHDYFAMRSAIFNTPATAMHISADHYEKVYAGMVEYRVKNKVLLVVAHANGCCSMHWKSKRDKVIKQPNHPEAGPIAKKIIKLIEERDVEMVDALDVPIPVGSEVNFFALTDVGRQGYQYDMNNVIKKGHTWYAVMKEYNELAQIISREGEPV